MKTILTAQEANNVASEEIPNFQVVFKSGQVGQSIRSLSAEHVNSLIKVPGIIISCSRVRAKATVVAIRCSDCGHTKVS